MKQIAIWVGTDKTELDNYLKEGFTVAHVCAQSVSITGTQYVKKTGMILVILNI